MGLELLKNWSRDLELLLLNSLDEETAPQMNLLLKQYTTEIYHTYHPDLNLCFKKYIEAVETQLELLGINYKLRLKEYYPQT